jgi:predicted nucleic acid-binding protein
VILLDTTPLVALCDPRDPLHARALADLDRLGRQLLFLCGPVLTEACFLLDRVIERQRLDRLCTELGFRPLEQDENEAKRWHDVFRWLVRYAEHEPDWVDGYLAIVSGSERKAKVWTYDSEFRTIWRRLDGTRIPLAVR